MPAFAFLPAHLGQRHDHGEDDGEDDHGGHDVGDRDLNHDGQDDQYGEDDDGADDRPPQQGLSLSGFLQSLVVRRVCPEIKFV